MTKEVKQEQDEPLTENGIYRLGYHSGYKFGEAYAKANAKNKEWVGLTVDQIAAIAEWQLSAQRPLIDVIKAVEQALKEKNT